MKHFVVYHNQEKMGGPPVLGAFAYSNSHSSKNTLGNRIWLITGVGREYSLFLTFVVEEIRYDSNSPFRYMMIGRFEGVFKPLLLNDKPWFLDLLNKFGLGVGEIRKPKTINGLMSFSGG